MAEYLRPDTLEIALDALGGARWSVIAGGTDFYPARVGQALDEDVLDISALSGLRGIEEHVDHWRLGALTTWSDIIRTGLPPMFDRLKLAAREVGGVQNAAAHDVGRAINPILVEGQVHGGIAQGLGFALMEEYVPGMSDNLHDYLIPTFGDMPEIEVLIVEDAEPLGPYGAKGVGEPGLIPTAPAIFGAIRHAAGIRVTHAPALPHRVRAAILEKERNFG